MDPADVDTEEHMMDFMLVRLRDDPVFVQAMTEPLVDKFVLATLNYCGRYGRIFKITGSLAEVRFDGGLKRVVATASLVPVLDDECLLEIHEDWSPGQRCLLKNDPLFVHTTAERYNCGFSPPLLKFCGRPGRIERVLGPVADVRFDVRDKRRRVPLIALLPLQDDDCVRLHNSKIRRGSHVKVKDDPLYVQSQTSAAPSVPLAQGLLDWCGRIGVVQRVDPSHVKAEVRFDRNNLWMFPLSCLEPVASPEAHSAGSEEQQHVGVAPKWDGLTFSYLGASKPPASAQDRRAPSEVNYSLYPSGAMSGRLGPDSRRGYGRMEGAPEPPQRSRGPKERSAAWR